MFSKNKLKIYLLTLVSFLVGTSQFVIAGVLDKIALDLNISISSAGHLVTVFALTSAVGVPILTMVLAKHTLKNQLMLALVIFIIGAIMTPLDVGLEILMLARAITGVGSILFIVTAYIVATKLSGEGKEGSGMSYVALGFSLSQVAGVPIGRIISNLYDWQMIFYIISFFALLGLVAVYFSFQNKSSQEPPSIKEQFALMKNKKILLTLLITIFLFIMASAMNTYITPLIFSIQRVSEENLALIFTILGIGSVIGSKLGVALADKLGVTKILLSTMIVIVVSLIFMDLFSNSIFIFVVMLVTASTTIWMFSPTQSLNLSKMSPKNSSILLSLNSSFIQLGFGLGSFFGALTIEKFSIISIVHLGLISTLIAFAIYIFVLKFYGNNSK